MALRVWLPLNGDLHNQGISDTIFNGNPTSWSVDGKIGKCATWNGSVSNVVYNNTIDYNYTDNFSWTTWIKTNYTGTTTQYAFTVGRADAGGYGYGLQNDGDNSCAIRFGNSRWGVTVPKNTWTHLSFTKQGTKIIIYVNGEKVIDVAFGGTLPTYSDGNGVGLGCFHYSGNIYPFYGSLNDFRVYDHCLSPKEVKEISKGLVLHYPLNSQYSSSYTNLIASPYCTGQPKTSSYTTKQNTDGSWNFTYNYTGTGSDSWPSFRYGSGLPFTAGKTYMWSCKVRCNSANFSITARSARMDNDWESGYKTVVSAALADGQWHEYVGYRTLQAKSTRSGTEYNTSPCFEFYSESLKTADKVYTCNFDVKDIMVCETSTYVPFINNDWKTGVEDVSGYGYNGTISGNIVTTTDTPRYTSSSKFDTNAYIVREDPNLLNLINGANASITVSVWAKNSSSSPNSLLFGYGSAAAQNKFLLCHLYNSGAVGLCYYSNDLWGSITNFDINKWYHICYVISGTTRKIYVNGELNTQGTVNSTLSVDAATAKLMVGKDVFRNNYNSSGISDFRIYATALSDADIKELYEVSGAVDNHYNSYAYEFVEE